LRRFFQKAAAFFHNMSKAIEIGLSVALRCALPARQKIFFSSLGRAKFRYFLLRIDFNRKIIF